MVSRIESSVLVALTLLAVVCSVHAAEYNKHDKVKACGVGFAP